MPSTSTPDSESSASKRLRAALDECLSSIQSNGSFALFEHLPNPILPGITLKKGGPIGLPLTERDAQVIIAASHAAPFGKGEATIIDENIRKTWELSASSFEIRNPAWENFLQSIVAKVSEGLGIDLAGTGVRAELYKMLLYDKGAMFKPHQDSEKAPGMFATLVIALPSKHEGGQVRVNHGGLTKVFETSKFSEFDSSYLAWFANVTHEIRPVLAGYRLVLTYNLIQSNIGPHKPTASSINVMTKLRSTLFNWKQNLQNKDVPEILAYLLQHQYTNASLGYDGLKGQDKEVAAYLQEACRVSGFCLYLANLDRTVSGGTDDFGDLSSDYEYENTGRFHSGGGRFHDIFDESSRQTILKNVVELDGTDIDKDLNFDEERFVQTDPFGNEHPDDEDYAGTYGNGGPCATHFYHRTVALIIPRTYLVKFFLDASKEIASYSRNSVVNTEAPRIKQWLDRLSAQLALASVDSVHRCDMKEFCEFVISHCSTWESREVANSTLQCIGGLLIGYKLEALLPVVRSSIAALEILSDRLNILEQLRAGFQTDSNWKSESGFQIWVDVGIDAAVAPPIMMEFEKDAAALVNLSRRLSSWRMINTVLPVVKRSAKNTITILAFLTGIFASESAAGLPEEVSRIIFSGIVADFADSFSLTFLAAQLASVNKWGCSGSPMPELIVDKDNSLRLATVLYNCHRLELKTELEQLVTSLIMETKTVEVDLFHGVYLPVLGKLIDLLPRRSISESPAFQLLFQKILEHFILRYVGPEPAPPTDWSQPSAYCICLECKPLKQFLTSSTETVVRFEFGQKPRGQLLHFQTLLSRRASHLKVETEDSDSTLIVTKICHIHKAWETRSQSAKSKIEEIGAGPLKGLLGDTYEPIMSQSITQLSSLENTERSAAQADIPAAVGSALKMALDQPRKKRKISFED